MFNYKPDRRLPLLSAVDIVARSRSPHFASITHTFHPPCRQQGDPLLQQSLMGPSIIICYPNWNPLTLPAAPAIAHACCLAGTGIPGIRYGGMLKGLGDAAQRISYALVNSWLLLPCGMRLVQVGACWMAHNWTHNMRLDRAGRSHMRLLIRASIHLYKHMPHLC